MSLRMGQIGAGGASLRNLFSCFFGMYESTPGDNWFNSNA